MLLRDMIDLIRNQLKKFIKEDIEIDIFLSEKEEFGHYSTNVAFKLASILKKSSLEAAKELAEKFSGDKNFQKVEAVAPGFVNFWINPRLLQNKLKKIIKGGTGIKKEGKRLRINVEFVSANPTGPLTIANGRGGFYGDVLANVLEKAGNKVTREYYVNDAGNQVRILGESILAELGKAPKAKTHYQGEYVKKLAVILKRQATKDAEFVGKKAAEILLKEIKLSLKKAGIKHEVWFSEYKNLHKGKGLQKILEILKKKKLVRERDGALWLDDGVLIKSDGLPTYLLSDLAYHYDKFVKRKFDVAVDIWGADHHGYVKRLKKGVAALAIDPRKLKIIITQMVRLISKGKEARMSKRAGEFVTMGELLNEVGADAARFFFLMHSPDSHMDFDLDLAKERSQKNPVYYVQYAYVRAVNILKKADIKPKNIEKLKLGLLNTEPEIKLMLNLLAFYDVLRQTAEDYQVHRLTKHALDLARAFHNFYEKERVIGVGGELGKARLFLVLSVKNTMENLFKILGIKILEKM